MYLWLSVCNLCFQVGNSSALKWQGNLPMGFQKWQLPQVYHLNYSMTFAMRKARTSPPCTKRYYHEFSEIEPYLKSQSKVLQPSFSNLSHCGAFVTFSSGQLEWMTVPCDKVFRQVLVVCQSGANVTDRIQFSSENEAIYRHYWECDYGWVAIDSKCSKMTSLFIIAGHVTCHEVLNNCDGSLSILEHKNTASGSRHIKYYYNWLDDPQSQSFYAGTIQNSNKTCVNIRLAERVEIFTMVVGNESAAGDAVLCERDMRHTNSSCLGSQFQCADGSCVLSHYVCDGILDCVDGLDEEDCSHVCTISGETSSTNDARYLCYRACYPPHCICHVLYYHCEVSGRCLPASRICDGVADCESREDEQECDFILPDINNATMTVASALFVCTDGSVIPLEQFSDVIPDCPGADDENDFYLHLSGITTLNKTKRYQCSEIASTLCVKGFFRGPCYPRHKICLYEKDERTGKVLYCRNGAHLEDCFQHECPGFYKCRWSYCIPYHYVCDRVPDCPHGEDEENCSSLRCPGLLRCRHDQVCVHPNMIADNLIDCPISRDDEALSEMECPESCECLGNSAVCSFTDDHTLNQISTNVKKLTFQGATFSKPVAVRFPSLLILDLSDNGITADSLPKLQFLTRLRWLKLKKNMIESIHKSLVGLTMLKILEMQHNPMRTIAPGSFSTLTSLAKLNISCMKLNAVSHGTFQGLDRLRTLDISYNPIERFEVGSLHNIRNALFALHVTLNYTGDDLLENINELLKLEIIYVQSGIICKYLRGNLTCIAKVVYRGRCCHFINTKTLQGCLLCGGVLLVIMSTVALAFWLQVHTKIIPKFLMCVLNASTLCVAVYPFYVNVVHAYYQRSFLYHKYSFVNSYHCKLIAAIGFFSRYMLLFTLVLTLVHRFLITAWPLKQLVSSVRPYFISVSVTAIISFVTPVYMIFGIERFASGTICHIMPFSSRQIKNFPFSYWGLLSTESLLQVSVVSLHCLTVNSLRKSMNTTVKATASVLLKRRALKYSIFLGSVHLCSLTVSLILRILPTIWEYTDDEVLILICSLVMFEVKCPLLYTFATGQFRSRILHARR